MMFCDIDAPLSTLLLIVCVPPTCIDLSPHVSSKYFEPDGRRFRQMKVLEIGLGCNMAYGAVSFFVWGEQPCSEALKVAGCTASSLHLPTLISNGGLAANKQAGICVQSQKE